jgi:hypothetical protein
VLTVTGESPPGATHINRHRNLHWGHYWAPKHPPVGSGLRTLESKLRRARCKLDDVSPSLLVRSLRTDLPTVYSDAELCSNGKPQCKRRSQLGYVVTVNNCPIMWQSKCTLPLKFSESAHPAQAGFSDLKPVTAKSRLLDEHADFSSAAAEISAAANYASDVIAFSYVREEA